jgi:hypothetical protein
MNSAWVMPSGRASIRLYEEGRLLKIKKNLAIAQAQSKQGYSNIP